MPLESFLLSCASSLLSIPGNYCSDFYFTVDLDFLNRFILPVVELACINGVIQYISYYMVDYIELSSSKSILYFWDRPYFLVMIYYPFIYLKIQFANKLLRTFVSMFMSDVSL